ncbi:MAG: 5-oxoprolinase subunit PxpA [Cytophagales bacterium]|nr:5-oxoprolinase subunit PxpA [Cytophagales bacterium]
MISIDLNCDVGEGIGNESELLPLISSCNISCGLHAGDDQIIQEVISLAIRNDVAIGAHPSFDDRANFGRVEMQLPKLELMELVSVQIRKLKEMTQAAGGYLHHVKPHGALYNMAAKSADISETIVSVIEEIGGDLMLYGMADSEMQKVALRRIRFVPEGFADRRYSARNQLVSRNDDGLIENIDKLKKHVYELVVNNQVHTSKGHATIQIKSLCVHGDTPGAIDVVKEIRSMLASEGIEIKTVEK